MLGTVTFHSDPVCHYTQYFDYKSAVLMFMISNAVTLQGVLSHELGYWGAYYTGGRIILGGVLYWGAYSISSSTNNHKNKNLQWRNLIQWLREYLLVVLIS